MRHRMVLTAGSVPPYRTVIYRAAIPDIGSASSASNHSPADMSASVHPSYATAAPPGRAT